MNEQKDSYSFAIALGCLILADELKALEHHKERKRKKSRVVKLKQKEIKEAFPEFSGKSSTTNDLRKLLPNIASEWLMDQSITYLIDLVFTNPFAPYELKFTDKDFTKALTMVASKINLRSIDVENVIKTRKQAISAHRHIDWVKIAALGLGGLVVFGIGGLFLAPIIGTAIGTAAGLYGAAATSHGLAILGGGSLAIGGAGMAGGMALVTGVGAAAGTALLGGSKLLLSLGAAQAKVELIKLQVNYKIVLLGNQMQVKKAQSVIRDLDSQEKEIKRELKKEQELNEKNSNRIKNLEELLAALNDSIKWMKEQKVA